MSFFKNRNQSRSTPVAPPFPTHLQSNSSSPERPNNVQQHHSPSRLTVNTSVSPQRPQRTATTTTIEDLHDTGSRLSPIPVPIFDLTPPRAHVTFNQLTTENGTASHRTPSPRSPKKSDTLDLNGHQTIAQRSPSPLFHHSSIHANNTHEHSTSEDVSDERTNNRRRLVELNS